MSARPHPSFLDAIIIRCYSMRNCELLIERAGSDSMAVRCKAALHGFVGQPSSSIAASGSCSKQLDASEAGARHITSLGQGPPAH